MRKKIIAGNWKMFKTNSEAKEFFSANLKNISRDDIDVMIFPTFTALASACDAVLETNVKIGAQNMHFEDEGAFTGEISADMLKELGVSCVLIGHSERRQYFNETDLTVNLKTKKALEKKLIPVICVGENLAQREDNKTFDVISKQLKEGLKDIKSSEIVIAYEPIWAIGTGKTATDDQAEEVCSFIRKCLKNLIGEESENIRILYGGSVKPSNISGLMNKPDIDGALVGGASLTSDFVKIVNY